ncbi:hypothetical protein GGR06_001664 [Bacteroides reticulotermitis]|uniref:Uncharacterized protein n=1 Tax=Bacteroides reticulotermitis TaxID=1133319 RepID=A0A840D0G3_9BACE|nr:hypothetical protein [Bacteroides reticulotermitis]
MKEVTMYQCGFCGKTFNDLLLGLSHEEECFMNPKAKGCCTCDCYGTIGSENGIVRCKNGIHIGNNRRMWPGLQNFFPEYKRGCPLWKRKSEE